MLCTYKKFPAILYLPESRVNRYQEQERRRLGFRFRKNLEKLNFYIEVCIYIYNLKFVEELKSVQNTFR